MCVIIHLNKGVVLPSDKLEIAADINKDGFGLSWVEKGRIKTIREITKNDAKHIGNEITRLGKHELFLHLRHSTVGKIDLTNSHPFFPLEKSDGIEIGFMHNGTLSNYVPVVNSEDDGKSDTYLFSQNFLRAFLRRMKVWHDNKRGKKEPLLNDWMIHNVLMSKIGHGGSVFLLFDNLGNHLIVNKSKGKEFETNGQKWWASNDYSFNDWHNRSSKWSNSSAGHYPHAQRINQNNSMFGADDDGMPWQLMQMGSDIINMSTWEQDLEVLDKQSEVAKSSTHKKLAEQIKQVALVVNNTQGGPGSMAGIEGLILTVDMKRTTFLEQAGLKSVDELFKLSAENFNDLFAEYPKAMADAFVDVVMDNKRLQQRIKELEATVPTQKAA